MRQVKKRFLLFLLLCGMLLAAGCKNLGREQPNSTGEAPQSSSGQNDSNADGETNDPVGNTLKAFQDEKYARLGELYQLMDASDLAKDSGNYMLFQNDCVQPIYESAAQLDLVSVCFVWLEGDGDGKWKLDYETYSGSMQLADGSYTFSYKIAADADTGAEEDGSNAGYHIEGSMNEDKTRFTASVYTGANKDDENAALLLWFELRIDGDDRWAQYYYAVEDNDMPYKYVREHVGKESYTYGLFNKSTKPGSILETAPDADSYFANADVMGTAGKSGATVYQEGEVYQTFGNTDGQATSMPYEQPSTQPLPSESTTATPTPTE